jgi:hypothetical protein
MGVQDLVEALVVEEVAPALPPLPVAAVVDEPPCPTAPDPDEAPEAGSPPEPTALAPCSTATVAPHAIMLAMAKSRAAVRREDIGPTPNPTRIGRRPPRPPSSWSLLERSGSAHRVRPAHCSVPGGVRTMRRKGTRGVWGHRLAWLLGAALVSGGALLGAFGTVAWLTVLCASSFQRVLFGILGLGVAPVLGGGALLWAGLGVLEAQSARSRVRGLADERFVEAAHGGRTAAAVAAQLGAGDVREVEHRLDDLCAREILFLDVSDEGEVLYRAPRGQAS